MFILRKLSFGSGKSANEFNLVLGESYSTVTPYNDSWDELFKSWEDDKIYSFIVYQEGAKVFPLYRGQHNYIMTSDGKTFSNLTYK